MKERYVIGVDFGTDSVRAIIVNPENGEEVASSIFDYPRWGKGLYCDATKNRFRQHPLDYIEGLETVLKECLSSAGGKIRENVCGISVATTGSTPGPVNSYGIPLALTEKFSNNPDAMFVLWKDHSSIAEAKEINDTAKSHGWDYLKYVGGNYSSEWYWAKLLHVLRSDKLVAEHCYTWVEHSDWVPFLLTGGNDAKEIKRNVCAAGHKGLWAEEFGGMPPEIFFNAIDPVLKIYAKRFGDKVYTADKSVGNLSKEWAEKLGLSTEVRVGIGVIDAHVGAVGSGIKPYYMTKVIGTSTCDMMVVPREDMKGRFIEGISGQVDGSVIPGMIGLEAGQSAFGDIYAWLRDLLLWPFEIVRKDDIYPFAEKLYGNLKKKILPELDRRAAKLSLNDSQEYAIDWFNGRRTPNVNPDLKGMIGGLTLGTDAPRIYKALVESTCFGSRAIVDCIESQGIQIKGINAVGGIAVKSDYVMQTMANVLNRPVHVSAVEQTVALGAAMFAAVVGGVYDKIESAIQMMGRGSKKVFYPLGYCKKYYNERYQHYETG